MTFKQVQLEGLGGSIHVCYLQIDHCHPLQMRKIVALPIGHAVGDAHKRV